MNKLAWIGTVCGILASIMVASNNGWQTTGYVFFLIGSLAWLAVSIKRKDAAGAIQWFCFTVINAYGIVNYYA